MAELLSGTQLQCSGHGVATLPGTITNHNQNMTTDAVNSSDSNSTDSLDEVASCWNL
jgi:hypothetical protein